MPRAAAMTYCIASLLMWLIHEPFFHAHTAEEGGELHAHFDVEEEAHEHEATPEFDHPSHGHHGTETSAFTGQTVAPTALFAEAQQLFQLIDPPVLEGAVIAQPVRVHDPPARVSSSPRSPPA